MELRAQDLSSNHGRRVKKYVYVYTYKCLSMLFKVVCFFYFVKNLSADILNKSIFASVQSVRIYIHWDIKLWMYHTSQLSVLVPTYAMLGGFLWPVNRKDMQNE